MRATLLLLLGLLLLPAAANAQVADNYTLRVYNQGAAAPLTTFTFVATATVCNQAPPVSTTSTVNPSRVVWNDINNAGKVCVWTDPGNGVLFSLPVGSFEGTLSAANSIGSSVESARVPFSRADAPSVPGSVRIVR